MKLLLSTLVGMLLLFSAAPVFGDEQEYTAKYKLDSDIRIQQVHPSESARAAQGRGEARYAGRVSRIIVGTPNVGFNALGCAKYPFLDECKNKFKREPNGDVVVYDASLKKEQQRGFTQEEFDRLLVPEINDFAFLYSVDDFEAYIEENCPKVLKQKHPEAKIVGMNLYVGTDGQGTYQGPKFVRGVGGVLLRLQGPKGPQTVHRFECTVDGTRALPKSERNGGPAHPLTYRIWETHRAPVSP